MGQAIALSKVSGNVKISHCIFTDNVHYRGHGTAIYYSSDVATNNNNSIYSCNITINTCNFTRNNKAESIVYFGNSESIYYHDIVVNNSNFIDNQGTSIYLSYQNLFLKGNNLFSKNSAEYGSGIYATNYSKIMFTYNSVTRFNENNKGTVSGGAIFLINHASASFEANSVAEFNNNNATNKGGCIFSYNNSKIIFKGISNVNFDYNTATYGGALYSEVYSDIIFDQNCIVTFEGNKADFGGAMHFSHDCNVVNTGNSLITFQNNLANEDGGSVYFYDKCNIAYMNNSMIKFHNNTALKYGGAICFKDKSNLKSEGKSSLTFNNNNAEFGGAIVSLSTPGITSAMKFINITQYEYTMYSERTNYLRFAGQSTIIFTNNVATQGGATYSDLDVIFDESSSTTFTHNNGDYGGALYLEANGGTMFKGNSNVKFANNNADQNGGAAYYTNMSNVIIQDNCSVLFYGNTAKYDGGAVHFTMHSDIIFPKESKSKVTFSHNKAKRGGAIFSDDNSRIVYGGNTTAVFTNNEAAYGGAMHCTNGIDIKIKEHFNVDFENNKATQGGAIYIEIDSNIIFGQNSKTIFVDNKALEHGGAIVTKLGSHVQCIEDSFVAYYNNTAMNNGGSIYSESKSVIEFEGNSKVTFNNSISHNGAGGAIYSRTNSEVTFKGNSKINFTNCYATQGGIIHSSDNSLLLFDETTFVNFSNSTAISGGALLMYGGCHAVFQGSHMSMIKFDSNKAEQYGGAIHLEDDSGVTLNGSLTVTFNDNEATLGGAVFAKSKSNFTITATSTAKFDENKAKMGGATFIETSHITFARNCSVTFYYNTASQDGGAIYLSNDFFATFNDNANIAFVENTASDYGGAIYSRIIESKINLNNTNILFQSNHARTAGSSVFVNLPISCNSSCLSKSILGISKESFQHSYFKEHMTTSPRKLALYHPAHCIDNNENEKEGCNFYYVKNIMLGQEILIDACMYDYYDRPGNAAEFLVNDEGNEEFYNPGSKYILVSCNTTFHVITLIGNSSSPVLPSNYSMNITLYVNRKSEMKTISVNLTVELVPCHPGFWYYQNSHQCECYNASGIVLCSNSSSAIKRGYWFGSVDRKPTVTYCPINYCNFTCCETSNGYYELSPVRDNQCNLHRSGTACGSCEESYTLSFDSAKCVHMKTCTTGQTILLVALVILYWATIITMVFLMMHFKVDIGYLYAIMYYYSVVDLLLSQNWYLSNELNTTINVMSSISKVTPQFLGQFCFVKNLSGIDQQFIHYVYPAAVSLFLVVITILARNSHRLSSFVSRGIIHVICCLLLLSYTSIATTSLLLMRPLVFLDVDKIYTYVSPDIEYFHGRHLFYAILAMIATIIIVIGLPLLLVLEPFLNSRISFIRIKPLLDQFQGTYKDRYRCFAAYYMICRLVIISIIIANSSNDFIAQYVLISACVVIALIHQIFQPYSNYSLNILDGIVLQSMVLVSLLPLVQYFDNSNSDYVVGITFILLILPSVSFAIMKLVINRLKIKKILLNCYFKCKHSNSRSYNEIPLNNEITLDDSKRTNTPVTICHV